jgi:hypothetical protein
MLNRETQVAEVFPLYIHGRLQTESESLKDPASHDVIRVFNDGKCVTP